MNGEKLQHSSYYHKRFEGWMERRVEDSNGKKHIERVYTGTYYQQEISDRERMLIRPLYIILYLLSTGCFLFASTRSTGSNQAEYVQFLCFLTILAMIAMLVFLASYIVSPKRMTIWEHYAGPVRVRAASLASAILMGSVVAAVIFFLIGQQETELQAELPAIAGYIAAALPMFGINFMEAKMKYTETPSGTGRLTDGYLIER